MKGRVIGMVLVGSLLSYAPQSGGGSPWPVCVNVSIDAGRVRFLSYVAMASGLTPTDIVDVSISDLESRELMWLVTGHDHWDFVPSVLYGSIPEGWRQIFPMVVTRFGVNALGASFRLGAEQEPRCSP